MLGYTAGMCVRGGKKENTAILFLLLWVAAYAAADGDTQCETAGWRECLPITGEVAQLDVMTSGTHTCVFCSVVHEVDTFGSLSPLIAKVDNVAIRGYPFDVLSTMKLAQLEHVEFHRSLALIDADITDVDNNTFARFSSLIKLSLDSNRLSHVKQTWFTGLEKLFVLILSNNNIKQIDPRSFVHLKNLGGLDLENNLLQVVDPSWLFGPRDRMTLDLRSNAINSISPASFHHLQLTWLDLRDNDLSCLDEEVLVGQSTLVYLRFSSGVLSSIQGAKPHSIRWSLNRLARVRKAVTMIAEVPTFIFCVKQNSHKLSFGWVVDTSDNGPDKIKLDGVNPGISCGELDRSLSTISIQAPVVVLATGGSLDGNTVPNKLEQCRQVWEYGDGIKVGMMGNIIFQLVSMATGNTTVEDVAMSFVQTQSTNKPTNTEYTTRTNTIHDDMKNITCILITKDEHTELFFTIHPTQHQTHTTVTTYRTNSDHSSSLTHNSGHTEKGYTSSEPRDTSTLQVSTTYELEVPPATDHVLISVVVSAVVSVVVASLVALVLVRKLRSARLNAEDGSASDDAHIWVIPPGVAFPGLLRSASLPALSGNTASDDIASCRSLPAVLDTIDPTYSEIPDDIATAHRPLPSLPHTYWEIPDDVISGVVRSVSLPVCTLGKTPDDAASCKSLPAVLQSVEPTYSEIPDNIAAAQRPLPALPRSLEPDDEADTQRHMPAPPHTYSEIPDDEDSGPIPFYADAAELSLHAVTNRRQNRRAFRDNTTASSRHRRSGRSIAAYGSAEVTRTQVNNFYRNAPEAQSIRIRRRMRTALVSHAASHGVRTYVNATDAILSSGQNVTEAHIAFLTFPDAYLPWGDGTRITPRRASFPLVTLPNTYWPWDIPGDGNGMRPRGESLPSVTLPNTYWPWDIPGEGTRNTTRRSSFSLVTLPNAWPWDKPGEGTRNTTRRSSLPPVTLPNTYWPSEMQR
uniref:LRRCT domain-containing protein n=1 Tax=Branchiostoma floridae TaxID=7739 RepID=C3XSD0_BRAFL|eukprot:XP_002613049.1 hypothetical protein BRAFLDRAFT_82199 [Branchiostoma floridae]